MSYVRDGGDMQSQLSKWVFVALASTFVLAGGTVVVSVHWSVVMPNVVADAIADFEDMLTNTFYDVNPIFPLIKQ